MTKTVIFMSPVQSFTRGEVLFLPLLRLLFLLPIEFVHNDPALSVSPPQDVWLVEELVVEAEAICSINP